MSEFRTRFETSARESVIIDFVWRSPEVATAIFIFALDEDRKFPSKDHLVSPTSESDLGGFVRALGRPVRGQERMQAQFHLPSADEQLQEVVVLLAVSESGSTLEDVDSVTVSIWDPLTGDSDGSFETASCGVSKSAIIAKLLRTGEGWEFISGFEPKSMALFNLANELGIANEP